VSDSTRIDIRLPLGALFAALGIILSGYGIATNGDTSRYASSLSVNINLWWGLVMLVFGILMLVAALRGGRQHPLPELSAEGVDTEQREHELGLER
jgi:hypothetical protein